MMAVNELEPVLQARRISISENAMNSPAPAVSAPPSPSNVKARIPPPLDPAVELFQSHRKELISIFVECTNLNLPHLPQSFFQTIFKGKKPDSSLPSCRVDVDIKAANEPKSILFHQTTESHRVNNPAYSMGLTIPIPLSKPNSDEYHMYFSVVQTDEGYEKVVASAEMMCGVLLDSFKQGTPVVHLPLRMNNTQEAILSLTFARIFPIKHNILPSQNMLMNMYAFFEPKEKSSPLKPATQVPLLASEELVEAGYMSSIPPLFLQQCRLEMTAAHRLWSVRYANARKIALEFDSDDDALAHGCDVYSIEIISGKGLSLPADLNLQPALASPVGNRSRSNSNPNKDATQKITLNPFVSVKYKETSKGKRPIEVSEGKTNIVRNTSEPHWEENTQLGKTPNNKTSSIVFYRPNEGQPSHALKRILEFDVMSECNTHFDGEIPLGKVILPVDAVMYEGKNASYDINLTQWFAVVSSTGEERGEILIRLQMRRTTTMFTLEPEPSLAAGSLLQLADPKRHAKFLSNLESSGYNSTLSVAESKELVNNYQNAINQLETWQTYVEHAHNEWFRSSELKSSLEVQPLATNMHVSYFRLYKAQAPARETVLEGKPRDVEIGIAPGEELNPSIRNLLRGLSRGSRFSLEDLVDHDSPLEVEATTCTVTCGAPTAHGLGLSQYGLVELEDKLLSVEKSLELNLCTYALRKSVCISQALSILIATFSSQLELVLQKSIPNHEWIMEQWCSVGFLIGFESLVSTQGKELHMLSDAWVAIKSLESIQLQILSGAEEMTFRASESGYILQLPIPSNVFGLLPQSLQDGKLISITAVLFTQGINEMQTLANVVGAVGIALQVRINEKCFLALQEYYERLIATPSLAGMTSKIKGIKLNALSGFIANSNETTMTKKNHRILLEASDTIRRLNGGRVTFCKSGKDRTAMSVTLDQARLVGSFWKHSPQMINEHTSNQEWTMLKPIANLMREFGVRIQVAKKNVGNPRYSFNALQRKMLPKMYRPPHGAIKGDHDVDDS